MRLIVEREAVDTMPEFGMELQAEASRPSELRVGFPNSTARGDVLACAGPGLAPARHGEMAA
jgi:hypothetical protein